MFPIAGRPAACQLGEEAEGGGRGVVSISRRGTGGLGGKRPHTLAHQFLDIETPTGV